MTARWVVDEVQPARDLSITWQPISLLFKNDPDPDSDYYKVSSFTLRLMRVLESVRAAEGDDAVGPLYWEYGRRIHHDGDKDFAAADALAAVGYDTSHAVAFDDESWDGEIRKRMDEGLALCGDNVGTPDDRPQGPQRGQAGLLRPRHHPGAAQRELPGHVGRPGGHDERDRLLGAQAHKNGAPRVRHPPLKAQPWRDGLEAERIGHNPRGSCKALSEAVAPPARERSEQERETGCTASRFTYPRGPLRPAEV